MFEQTFKNLDDIMFQEPGCNSELDYAEQTSWMLFLKYLDDLERNRELEAMMDGTTYQPLFAPQYRWSEWAVPKDQDGKPDLDNMRIGQDLVDFVNNDLMAYLRGFKQTATDPNSIRSKIGEIFGEVRNKFGNGYMLRDALDKVDELNFGTQDQKSELSDLYETRIKNMGNAGRNGGQYYTPRPLIRAMIKVINPKLGETIYDPAAGSAGFLCEAFEYLRDKVKSPDDRQTLQQRTFYAKEQAPLAYVIGLMNMILHGVEAPNYLRTDTLSERIADIEEKDRHNVILANPPFGTNKNRQLQQNFPVKSSESAYMFMQHFIESLKAGGRAGVVIKNTFLSNTDTASITLRRQLLADCALHTILDCPSGTFLGAGVKTVVLFFERGRETQDIWYYQLDPGRNMGKTNPLNDADLAEFVEMQRSRALSEKSWLVKVGDLDEATVDLSVKNPNAPEEAPLRAPEEIIADMLARDAETAKILEDIRGML
ncbi:N-6 DNA methylase [Cognatiyoonia sp. IB215182]|uniref:class I SAM-dependent DNA methyltransferase n=1 Tax=Cognatiyoonia sp. IB215182 TaxID=3097353 RepID=UPI002A0F53B0|nr:N-6 DNA methylase [Cognatiyoonia sp. IB215182]MDX8353952.1 N-6 DNA methylase [Cognatiyoonia sp. IB215182]